MSEEIEHRIRSHQKAIEDQDSTALDQILDDNYLQLVLHPQRAEYSREMILQGIRAYHIRAYEIEDQRVDLDGDSASVFHRHKMAFEIAGRQETGSYVMTDVWRRRGDSWRLWRRYVTQVSS